MVPAITPLTRSNGVGRACRDHRYRRGACDCRNATTPQRGEASADSHRADKSRPISDYIREILTNWFGDTGAAAIHAATATSGDCGKRVKHGRSWLDSS